MPGREMRALGDSGEDSPHRSHGASSIVTALSRTLEAESEIGECLTMVVMKAMTIAASTAIRMSDA
jgi:hypothetical protein